MQAISLSTLTPEVPVSGLDGCLPTIILQPNGDLILENGRHFQRALQEAIELATETIIVDLLWVKQADAEAILALVHGVETAIALGKQLSFQGMTTTIRNDLETEWEQQRSRRFGAWQNIFKAELEAFLVTPVRS